MTREEYLKFLNDPKPVPLVERWREAGKRVGDDWVIPNRPYRVITKAGPDVEIGELRVCTQPDKRSGTKEPGGPNWRWFSKAGGEPGEAVWLGPEDVELVEPVQLDDANGSIVEILLHHTTNGHNRFYRMKAWTNGLPNWNWVLERTWGRIGTRGKINNPVPHKSRNDVLAAMVEQARKELRKGYEVVAMTKHFQVEYDVTDGKVSIGWGPEALPF